MCWFRQSIVVKELKCFLLSHFYNAEPNCFPSVQTKCVSLARIMLQDVTVSGLEIEIARCASTKNKPIKLVNS